MISTLSDTEISEFTLLYEQCNGDEALIKEQLVVCLKYYYENSFSIKKYGLRGSYPVLLSEETLQLVLKHMRYFLFLIRQITSEVSPDIEHNLNVLYEYISKSDNHAFQMLKTPTYKYLYCITEEHKNIIEDICKSLSLPCEASNYM